METIGQGHAAALWVGLHLLLMFAVAEAHDLHEPPRRLGRAPVGADLLVGLEVVAAEPRQRLLEALDEPRVLGALVLGDDVAVGLQ